MNNYEVIISRLGVPFLSVEISAESAEDAAAGAKQSRVADEHRTGDTYDAVKINDADVCEFESGFELAYADMCLLFPAFAEHLSEAA